MAGEMLAFGRTIRGMIRRARAAAGWAVRRYLPPMSTFHSIAVEALKLDEADRLRLAAELIDSVEGAADPDWDAAWLAEVRARRAHGVADAVPWPEARERVLRRIASK